jgi:hypothetical protein
LNAGENREKQIPAKKVITNPIIVLLPKTFIALCFSSSMRKAAVPSFAFPFVNPLLAEIVSISKEEVVSKLLKFWSLVLLSAALDL